MRSYVSAARSASAVDPAPTQPSKVLGGRTLPAMRLAALTIALVVVLPSVASASEITTTVKRLRTSKTNVINHVRAEPNLGRGHDIQPYRPHDFKCKGWKMLHGRALVWTCSFRTGPDDCTARWKMGREQQTINGHVQEAKWRDEWLAGTCPHP